jgi:hypothetical protein
MTSTSRYRLSREGQGAQANHKRPNKVPPVVELPRGGRKVGVHRTHGEFDAQLTGRGRLSVYLQGDLAAAFTPVPGAAVAGPGTRTRGSSSPWCCAACTVSRCARPRAVQLGRCTASWVTACWCALGVSCGVQDTHANPHLRCIQRQRQARACRG